MKVPKSENVTLPRRLGCHFQIPQLSNLEPCGRRTKLWLPPELFDRIIDHLHDSIGDLLMCSLVCKAWVTSCRSHLFYRICIDSKQRFLFSQVRRLRDAVLQSPDIAFCVRELSISDAGSRLAVAEVVLLPLLRSFKLLRKLEIRDVQWNWLTFEMMQLFTDILNLPSLVHFETGNTLFHHLGDFIILLRPHLKRLVLGIRWVMPAIGVDRIINRDDQVVMEKYKPCLLEHLKLFLGSGTFTFVDWLSGPQSTVDLSNLRALDITLCSTDAHQNTTVVELVRKLGSSLEHLTICGDFCGLGAPLPKIGNLQNLHTLSVITIDSDPMDAPLCVGPLLLGIVAPKLRRICFDLRCSFPTGWKSVPENINPWHCWEMIDQILGSQAFGSLCNVKIILRVCCGVLSSETLLKKFHLLGSRGIVELEEIVDHHCLGVQYE